MFYRAYVWVYGAESYWYWNPLAPQRTSEADAQADIDAYLAECKVKSKAPSKTKIGRRDY